MEIFRNRMQINPNGGLQKLNPIQERVFNDALENAVLVAPDSQYGDDMHQIITMSNGDTYYFDSYKYLYPTKANDFMEVVNCNVGPDDVVAASLYGEGKIRVEHYAGEAAMKRTIYELPQNVENLPQYLLSVASLHPSVLENLTKLSEVTFLRKNDMIVGYDENENAIYQDKAGASFYDDTVKGVCATMDLVESSKSMK